MYICGKRKRALAAFLFHLDRRVYRVGEGARSCWRFGVGVVGVGGRGRPSQSERRRGHYLLAAEEQEEGKKGEEKHGKAERREPYSKEELPPLNLKPF